MSLSLWKKTQSVSNKYIYVTATRANLAEGDAEIAPVEKEAHLERVQVEERAEDVAALPALAVRGGGQAPALLPEAVHGPPARSRDWALRFAFFLLERERERLWGTPVHVSSTLDLEKDRTFSNALSRARVLCTFPEDSRYRVYLDDAYYMPQTHMRETQPVSIFFKSLSEFSMNSWWSERRRRLSKDERAWSPTPWPRTGSHSKLESAQPICMRPSVSKTTS